MGNRKNRLHSGLESIKGLRSFIHLNAMGFHCSMMPQDRRKKLVTDSIYKRLEALNDLGNLRLKYLQRVYDGRPILERYELGETLIHVHVSRPIKRCLIYRRADYGHPMHNGEMPVFVCVGQISERPRPIASVVRLQRFEQCLVLRSDSAEVFATIVPETLFGILDRELCSALGFPGIGTRKRINNVVKGRPHVVNDLSYRDRDEWINGFDWNLFDCSGSIRADVHPFLRQYTCASDLEIVQVFACPDCPELSTSQRSSHALHLSTECQSDILLPKQVGP